MKNTPTQQFDTKKQEPPFYDTWFGAFLIVPTGFMIAMWAYYEFIRFTAKSWAVYQQFGAMTTVQTDMAVIAIGILAVYAYNKYTERMSTVWQALLSIPVGAIWISLLWATLDLVIKFDVVGRVKDEIEQAYRVTKEEPSIFDRFMPFNGIPVESLMVSVLAIASFIAMIGVLAMAAYMVYMSKKTVVEDKTAAQR